MKRILLLSALMVLCLAGLEAQTKTDLSAKVGKGIQFKTSDDLFYLKFTTRFQSRWDFTRTESTSMSDATLENKAWVKRARLKFDGYFINKSLVYKIEYDLAGGYVRDALFKYKKNNLELWFGQGKLPGNRERVVSSGNLQFVDRSLFNSYYTLDRDAGVQLHHKMKIGNAIIYDRWAVTSGAGIKDNKSAKSGVSLTGKLEVLPMGEFKSKGLYKTVDLSREETAKVAFAGYVNFNKDAYKDKGQIGKVIGGEADLLNIGGDFLLKYRGYSLLVEAGRRSVTDDNEFVYDGDEIVGTYYTGHGANVQTGYVFKNNWELSGRYSFTKPDEPIYDEMTDYTLGVSKYIVGHNFKFQGDVTLRDHATGANQVITRLQVEFQF